MIFGKLFDKAPKLLGNTEPICPHCSHRFDKFPGKKTKCIGCDNFVYVRTRLSDNNKVLVTEDHALIIDKEWDEELEKFRNSSKNLSDRDQVRGELLIKGRGKEPSDSDVDWVLANKRKQMNALSGDFGKNRNENYTQFAIAMKEKRYELALGIGLNVCLHDILGDMPFFAPRVIKYLKKIKKELELSDSDYRQHILLSFDKHIKRTNAKKEPPYYADKILEAIEIYDNKDPKIVLRISI